MSAMNAAVFPDRVILVSDSAYCMRSLFVGRGEKFVAMPHLNAVVGFRGHAGTLDRLRRILPNFETLDDFLANGPRSIRRRLWWKTLLPYYGEFEIVLAGVDSEGVPFVNYLSSRRKPKFEWVNVEYSIFAPLPELKVLAEVTAQCGTDVDGAMVEMLQHQRQVHFGIGGHATITTVTSEGISVRELCRWPDERWQLIKRESLPSRTSKRSKQKISSIGDYRS